MRIRDLNWMQLEAYLERGYTCERMIADLGGGTAVERSLVMEKIF